METTNHIGQRVKRARLGLGLTQDVLAERVGCATQTIRKIEAGERRPSYQMAERLASTLGFSPDEQRAFVADARQFETPTEPQREPEQTERRQPRNLPTYLTPFLGRSGLQRELARRLADPDCRLVTLLGPGGIGKTRLAVEAIRVAAPHPYDVAFVPLASIADAQEIVPAIGAALEYSFSGAVDLTTQLVRRLREERLLLVLDNLEHLTEQRGLTTILTTLLHHVPGLTILATSREQLMMGGEWVIALDGLDVPADESGQQIEQIEAVALFVERAHRLDHSFALQAENRVAVAQICRLLEGTPLAIELAASWVRTLTCAEIAAEIDRSLDFLSLADRSQPMAHRSLRAVFERSWQMLTAEQQLILAKLSVFRGGFTRDAAAQVAGATLNDLSAFVTKSLLRHLRQQRYDIHAILRQFAYERLKASGDRSDTHALHLQAMLRRAEVSAREGEGRNQVTYLLQLEDEQHNLRAALHTALEASVDDPAARAAGAQLVLALVQFWFVRGHHREGHRWAERALAMSIEDIGLQTRLRLVAGFFAMLHGEDSVALAQLETAVQLSQQLGDQAIEGRVWHYLGLVVASLGRHRENEAAQAHCVAIADALGDAPLKHLAIVELGCCAMQSHNYEQAKTLFQNAVDYYTASGNTN